MNGERAKIRAYVETLLKNSVDVGDRVFFSRIDPMTQAEYPACVFTFTSESVTSYEGDKYHPQTYLRTLSLEVYVVTLNGWDHLDYLVDQIEKAIASDNMLAKLLPGYNPEDPDRLSAGISLDSQKPYLQGLEGETPFYGAELTFSVPYFQNVIGAKKYDSFESFVFDIQDGSGRTLIAGEVDL